LIELEIILGSGSYPLYQQVNLWLQEATWKDVRHRQTFAWMRVGLLSTMEVALTRPRGVGAEHPKALRTLAVQPANFRAASLCGLAQGGIGGFPGAGLSEIKKSKSLAATHQSHRAAAVVGIDEAAKADAPPEADTFGKGRG
jgi:hypothetical protein